MSATTPTASGNSADTSISTKLTATASSTAEECHLFVLIHGLWGGPKHLLTIEKCIKELLSKKSDKKIVVLRPSGFRFWKTYDGIKICAERVLLEMFYEIETLKKNNLIVSDISVIGYSLGGLIGRYLIGILEDIGFFQYVTPVFYSSFATPHVGVEFFHDRIFDRTANTLGKFLLGKSGRELFMADHDQLLKSMAEPGSRYFKGLSRFEKRTLMANIQNDRTVAFFTSYITEYSPFDKFHVVKVKYIKDLPKMRIGNVYVRGKFVDLKRTHFVADSSKSNANSQEETSVTRSSKLYKVLIILFGSLFFLPIWVPTICTVSLVTSLYSMVKIRVLRYPEYNEHWARVKDGVYGSKPINEQDLKIGTQKRSQRARLQTHESFKGDTSEITENAMERMLYVEDRFMGDAQNAQVEEDNAGDQDLAVKADQEQEDGSNHLTFNFISDYETDSEDAAPPLESLSTAEQINLMFSRKKKLFEMDPNLHDECIRVHQDQLSSMDTKGYPVFVKEHRLPLNDDKRSVVENLNSINWVKLPVYLDAWNAHDGIVARRGPRTNPKGTATIALWVSVLREHLDQRQSTARV
ncbi:hypothetical protein CANTEDRAFT_123663 [Yamadazyma tenuis ATCC 10573]|uniref:DUF676 domain-containing protein n=1 Tax=Candida tenuis (strain ATCC 10573 / BCRC 21748 / CBS 615 / JCM 9827 / NBRC 10315 / NRRL Y-1498 / VKM Y-70) TaxID=590646 RepID=G3B6A8_CANTC|nr:uncharacterized protein CANTEDRAFT_123663 [Yamadazyma tenuis ATCC 10573]EGV63425.1 hypothetical protein CANTEDRAFT_123663 [Yamadazyma tenuis ATCC 10573]